MVFFSLNQRYDITLCVYRFVLFSQVSDVAYGPLVYRQGNLICNTRVLHLIVTYVPLTS